MHILQQVRELLVVLQIRRGTSEIDNDAGTMSLYATSLSYAQAVLSDIQPSNFASRPVEPPAEYYNHVNAYIKV